MEEEHLFTANHSNHFKRQDYRNDVVYKQASHLSLSPARRRCRLYLTENLCDSKMNLAGLSLPFASPGTEELLGKGRPGGSERYGDVG